MGPAWLDCSREKEALMNRMTMARLAATALVLCVALGVTACSNKKNNKPGSHGTYSPHYHDKNGLPHVKPGSPPPPPHNHHHGPTWR